MKIHTKLYLKHFGYDVTDFIPCEIIGCGMRSNEINHIKCRGAGGSKLMDFPENLMAICREHHDTYGDKPEHLQFLIDCHEQATGIKNVKEKINQVLEIRGIALIP